MEVNSNAIRVERDDDERRNINKNLVNYKEESLALFFDKPFEQTIYYKTCVSKRYMDNPNISANVLRLRQILIVLTIIEIFASIWGFSYYFIRRSMIYIVVNVSAFILSIIGVFSTIYLMEIGLIFYSLLTTSLPGTFFLYQLFEFFAIEDTKYKDNKRLNDNLLLLMFSLPYLYDFCVGIFSVVFIGRIAEFNDNLKAQRHNEDEERQTLLEAKIKNFSKKYSKDDLEGIREGVSQISLCVICLEKPREMAVIPCGHECLCQECSKALNTNFLLKNQAVCPLCRGYIENIYRIYK